MAKLQYNDLAQKMINGKSSTTQHWDVLCSYDISKVNEIFIVEHAKNPIFGNTKFTYTRNVPGIVSYTRHYDIKLGDPIIEFIDGQNGQCEVRLPIASGSSVETTIDGKSPSTSSFPKGYNIKMVVPLANITGNTTNMSGDVIVFSKKDESVVLHFSAVGANSTVQYEPLLNNGSSLQAELEDLISGFKGNIKDVDYDITTIKQDAAVSGHPIMLTPKSFVFTSSGQGGAGVLNIWIQTNESGQPEGIAPNPVFQINDNRYSPIPQNCTASVIFAKELIKHIYLTPALQKVSSSVTYTDTSHYGDVGIGIEISLPKYTKSYSKANRGLDYADIFTCDDLVVDFNSSPIFINLIKDTAQITWHWTQTLSYSRSQSYYFSGGPPISTEGKNQVTASINKTTPITSNNSEFEVNVSVDSTDIVVETKYIDTSSWLDYLVGVFGEDNVTLKNDVKSTIQNLAKMTIGFGGLNFFAEANIIFNGPVFHTKDVGFAGDILLIGDIDFSEHEHALFTNRAHSLEHENVSLAGDTNHSIQPHAHPDHTSCCHIL